MIVKTAGIRECFVTYWTHIRRFSCVSSDMNHQLIRQRGSLVTVGAGVMLLPHVSFYMVPKSPLWVKVCSHIGQVYGFFCVWILLGWFRDPELEKDFWQEEQVKGLSYVCVFWCLFRLLDTEKSWSHWGQKLCFSPVWILMGVLKLSDREMDFVHLERGKASRRCGSSGDSLGPQIERKSGHTGGRDNVSLRCGFSCASSRYLTERRTLYT